MAQIIYVVDDQSEKRDNFLAAQDLIAPKLAQDEVEACEIIFPKDPTDPRSVFWDFQQLVSRCRGVVMDLGINSRGTFDGIELAVAVRFVAQHAQNLTMPVVAYSASSAQLASMLPYCAAYPQQMFLVPKDFEDHSEFSNEERILMSLSRRQYDWFAETQASLLGLLQAKHVHPTAPKVGADDARFKSKASNWLEAFDTLLKDHVFWSYSQVRYGYLRDAAGVPREGYSGSEVFRVSATRDDRNWKEFVVKVAEAKSSASARLDTEIDNYLRFGEVIRNNVPLLLGRWSDGMIDMIAFELVRFSRNLIDDFAAPINAFLKKVAPKSKPNLKNDFVEVARLEVDTLTTALSGWHEAPLTIPRQPCVAGCYPDWGQSPDQTGQERLLARAVKRAQVSLSPSLSTTNTHFVAREAGIPLDGYLVNPLHMAHALVNSTTELLVATSVIHGDLHCGNILRRRVNQDLTMQESAITTAPQSVWTLIDFEYVQAGGHLPLDVATLECDLKFHRYPEVSSMDLGARFLMECELAAVFSNENDKTQEVIEKVGSSKAFASSSLSPSCELIKEELVVLRNAYIARQSRLRGPGSKQLLLHELHIALLFKSLECFTWYAPPTQSHCWFAACLAATELSQSLD